MTKVPGTVMGMALPVVMCSSKNGFTHGQASGLNEEDVCKSLLTSLFETQELDRLREACVWLRSQAVSDGSKNPNRPLTQNLTF